MKIIKNPKDTLIFENLSIFDHLQDQIKFSIEDDKDAKKLLKTKA